LSVSYTPEDIEAEEDSIIEDDPPQNESVEATLAILEQRTDAREDQQKDEQEPVDTSRRDRIRRSLSLNLPIISGKSKFILILAHSSGQFFTSMTR
jgi:hypothetical protein